ncbi:MAG: DUF4160 domain-containing protein [Methylobacter sp.]
MNESDNIYRKWLSILFLFKRRIHVHIVSGNGEAKFWLEPEIELAKNYQYSRKQLKEIELLLEEHYSELISAWQQHFPS